MQLFLIYLWSNFLSPWWKLRQILKLKTTTQEGWDIIWLLPIPLTNWQASVHLHLTPWAKSVNLCTLMQSPCYLCTLVALSWLSRPLPGDYPELASNDSGALFAWIPVCLWTNNVIFLQIYALVYSSCHKKAVKHCFPKNIEGLGTTPIWRVKYAPLIHENSSHNVPKAQFKVNANWAVLRGTN